MHQKDDDRKGKASTIEKIGKQSPKDGQGKRMAVHIDTIY
jgi:hypothetical protein